MNANLWVGLTVNLSTLVTVQVVDGQNIFSSLNQFSSLDLWLSNESIYLYEVWTRKMISENRLIWKSSQTFDTRLEPTCLAQRSRNKYTDERVYEVLISFKSKIQSNQNYLLTYINIFNNSIRAYCLRTVQGNQLQMFYIWCTVKTGNSNHYVSQSFSKIHIIL